MAYKFDPNARYAKSHEWVRMEGKLAVIGISDYAQHTAVRHRLRRAAGCRRYAEPRARASAPSSRSRPPRRSLPPSAAKWSRSTPSLEANPEWLNDDPFGKAWLVKVAPTDQDELGDLMDAKAYEAFVAEEEEKGEH